MFAIQCSKPQSIKTEKQRTTIQPLAESGGSFRLKDSTAENIKIPQKKLKTKRLSKESVIFIQQRANAAVEIFSEILEKRTRFPTIHVPVKLPSQITANSQRHTRESFLATQYPTYR